MSKWTLFWDMHSGGNAKVVRKADGSFADGARDGEEVDKIYIEAPIGEAKAIFFNRFGHNPERVSCTCCGEDYSIDESDSLEQASAYHRHCTYGYFRADGTPCEQDEAWVSGKGMKKGYSSRYVEQQNEREMGIRERCKTDATDKWGLYIPLADYVLLASVIVIRRDDIKSYERSADIPKQGYVWVD